MVEMLSPETPIRMKHTHWFPDSVSTFSAGSKFDCDSNDNLTMMCGNQMPRDVQDGKQGLLIPHSGSSSPNARNAVFQPDPQEKWYHLPRSSPVISRRGRFQIEEGTEQESSEKCSSLSLSLTLPSEKTYSLSPTYSDALELSVSCLNHPELSGEDVVSSVSVPQPLLSVTHSFPAAYSEKMSDTCCNPQAVVPTDRDEPGHLLCGSSESVCQSTPETRGISFSDGMVQLLNWSPQSGNKIRTFSDPQLITGPVKEKHISEDFYRNSVDLDQENAHFVVVDMVLEVLEEIQWTVYQQQLNPTDTSEDSHIKKCKNSHLYLTHSISSIDSGYDEHCGHRLSSKRTSQASVRRSLKASTCSAEDLAQQLLKEFRKQWVASKNPFSCGHQCIALEEFPLDTVSIVAGAGLSEEIRQRSRMRGTLIWAPPLFQIIFSVQPIQRRSDVIASQHFLCAGCGTKVEPRYIKRLRYCDYLGKYFCDGCHGGEVSVIPGRVLNRWDFGRHPVCLFSKQLLDSIWKQPLFKLTMVAKSLYGQAKELQRFKELQEQLISIKKLLRACRLSNGVLAEFQQLPSHLTEEFHVFSMDDFVKVKRGQLIITAKVALRSAIVHVGSCELCQAKGFICEFCRGQEVLFPYQTDICTRCQDCRACFHTACFRDEPCPRCARLQIRKSLQENSIPLDQDQLQV